MRLLNSITLLLLALLTACSGIDTDELIFADGRYIYTMNVEGGKTDYDGQSRATKTWSSGDKLYVRFSGNVTTTGVATYSGGTWTLAVDKQLTGSGSLTAVEIDGSTSVSGNTVTMSAQNAVYRCDNGTWNQSGTTLNVNINVKPVFGRLRFKGTSGTSFSLDGMTTYSAYNISTGQFTETTSAVSGSIASNGYSPYMYGRLSSQTLSTNGYTMECPTTMLRAGSSGWLNYPTASSHSGWSGGTSGGGSSSGHEYVDLGLSVKWATCNVGANKPEDYGDYYAWGETATKSDYSWATYKWCNGSALTMTKYCTSSSYGKVDNKTVLDPEDDVAHVKWGGNWRMPTREEQDELRTMCSWTWTSQNGVYGYKFTGPNGNSIFLPAAGYRNDGGLYNAGSYGRYWSSSLDSSYAYILGFYSGSVVWGSFIRYCGQDVRPVCP